jgi:GntR family transcriptional regulator
MQIHLNTADGVPIYLQIVQQVKYLVAAGRLAPGEELPAIRVLAERLVINPNTVARAYRELERQGIVTKHSTTGTFVSGQQGALARQEALGRLARRVDDLVAEACEHHVPADDLVELVRQRYRAVRSPRESST